MKLYYTDRATNDIEISIVWYERQRKGLGLDFLDVIEGCIKSIVDNPKLYAILYSNFRRCIIRRFPFSIFYTLEPDKIVIHSIFDNRQDPANKPK